MNTSNKNTFFTSDLHFSHANLLHKYQPNRKAVWGSVGDMTEGLISNWNSVVRPGDDVYNLGDMFFTNDLDRIDSILSRLNGNHHFIFGNHDEVLKRNKTRFSKYFVWMRDYHEFRIGNNFICLFHFPMAIWNKMHHSAFHLHGHSHGGYIVENNRIVDVGIDSKAITGKYEMRPFSLREICSYMNNRKIVPLDKHGN